MKPAHILTELKKKFDTHSAVVGFVAVGSQVRDAGYAAKRYSDVEAYVIVEDTRVAEVEGNLLDVIKTLDTVIFNYKNRWAGWCFVLENFMRVELPVVKRSQLDAVFIRPKAQPVEILIDKTEGELSEVLRQRPREANLSTIFFDAVNDFWYMSLVAVQYWLKGEIWNARHALEVSLVPALIKIMQMQVAPEALSLESHKRLEQFLPETEKGLLQQLSPGYDQGEVRNVLKKIVNVFGDRAQQAAHKHGLVYPQEVEEKMRPRLEEWLG